MLRPRLVLGLALLTLPVGAWGLASAQDGAEPDAEGPAAEQPPDPIAEPPAVVTPEGVPPGGAPPGDAPPGDASPEDGRSSRVAYDIHAKLLRMEREGGGEILTRWRLEGRETVTWTNHSGEEVSDLWFHLYLNAFSNNRSTHLIEAGESLRGQRLKDVNEEWWWGWQKVESLTVDGQDVLPSLLFRAPDSGPRAPDSREEEAAPPAEEETAEEEPAPPEDPEGATGETEQDEPTPTEDADEADAEPYLREQDRTVFSVDLPEPVPPGGSVTIELEWRSQLPRVRRRTGTKGDFLFVAQWFPKLGVYEAGRGWNCHQFHANSEFYADYGTYRVTLDLPKEFSERTGGSGVRTQNLVKGRDRVEVVYEAPSRADRERIDATGKQPLVHDFAWTADPRFVVHSDTFQFSDWARRYPEEVERAKAAFGDDFDVSLRDVAVTVLIHREREGQAERHFKATCAALFFYGLWWGEYPYEHITAVDPAWGARAAGGMEYPTLFTCGTRLFTTPDTYTPESVTVHECGHQFWYGLVGNNEFEGAWLDEGFNSYTDSEVLYRVYGPRRATTDYLRLPHEGVRPSSLPAGGTLADIALAREWGLGFLEDIWLLDHLSGVTLRPLRSSGLVDWWRDQPLLTLVPRYDDPRWGDRTGYLRSPDADPVDTWAFLHVDSNSYRTNSYPRTAAVLRTLAGMLGQEAFLRGMRNYSETWRYRHPYPDDFFASFIEGSGVDVMWYFEQAFRDVATIDWRVEVSQRRAAPEVGYFPREDGKLEERDPEADSERAAEVIVDEAAESEEDEDVAQPAAQNGKRPRLVEITLRRKGELCLPLTWEITIEREPGEGEDALPDEVRELVWTREQQLERPWWKEEFELPHDQKVKSVVLDPRRVLYLDEDMSDNQWFAEPERHAPFRWMEASFHQYQHLLHWFAGLGG